MTVNPDVVLTLTRVEPLSLQAASSAGDIRLARMADGSAPNERELQHLTDATPEDIAAAARHMQLLVDNEIERSAAMLEAVDLCKEYGMKDGEPAWEVWKRMTPGDRHRLENLMARATS